MLTATVTDWLPTTTRETDAATPADVDAALARSAAAGDATALEALYRRHAGRVMGVVSRLVGHDRARAEDLVQDAFVRAWQALPAYRHESAFSTWLHRLAVNTALMDLRAWRQAGDGARAVLVLFDVEGWKHEEIAEALEMAVGSSKAQLHRARGLLRARLEGHA